MALALLGKTLLRTAITRNLVSFPSQIPPFMKRRDGDVQGRIAQLYFVRGWSLRSIRERYGLSKAMTHKLLMEWKIRAVESGYIQEIERDVLAALVGQTEAWRPAATYLPTPKHDQPVARESHDSGNTSAAAAPISPAEHPAAFSMGGGV